MGELLSTVVQIVNSYVARLLDRRLVSQDAKVAAEVLAVVVTLQELCITGDRILALAGSMVSGTARADDLTEFAALVRRQSTLVDELRSRVKSSRALLATVEVEFAFAVAPFLDGKSGLLTLWQQQAALSEYSTSTLFFLPAASVTRAVAASRPAPSAVSLDLDRTDFVLVVADEVRSVRRQEVRDIRNPADDERDRLQRDITDARAALDTARALCNQLVTATQQTVGAEAIAQLRRTLAGRDQRR
ncbi:hypothetical protein U2F26_32750 [Micromonospora sp. 4G57]|uniref:Uncharacterized protein n=1 Tax=Micromonospora sicca TaxID=2202420 RepID=A0ABU5JNC3_9ACTN|nr:MULTISPECIES: hypothetical protein [unclassified Micromonospora]MDZ5447423.1 hypothetical protein [Micromonospora sp. 4G57]MDZ5494081.1 hypothetical protein [Micromonospora sp. 4G53]